MDTNELKNALSRLHLDLDKSQQPDGELRELLRALEQDIQHILRNDADEKSPEALDDADAGTLADRTQEISARFAANHPRLEPVLRELGAILERMGI